MENKEFDKMLKARFSNESLEGQDAGWQKLSAMLPASPQKRRAFAYWKIAASVLLVLGLGVGFSVLFQNQNENNVQTAKIAGNQNIQEPTSTNIQPSNSNTKTILSKQTSTSSLNTLSNTQKDISENATTPTLLPTTQNKENKNHSDIAATASPSQVDNLSVQQTSSKHLENNKTKALNPEKANQRQVAVNEQHSLNFVPATNSGNTINPMADPMATNHQTTSIVFGGGMNYGALKAGYNVNISAKHSLSKHVFVEGSVAFLYNNQAEKSSVYAAQNFAPTRPAPGQIPANKTTNPAASNFYYLSVNPTMGYQISKTIALSAGPDLQQRIAALGQDGTSIYTPGLDPRIIPQLDFGFTGKADFLISPKIETSILFRNGLNNLLKKPDLHPYLNRQYIQVQLNYNFLLSK